MILTKYILKKKIKIISLCHKNIKKLDLNINKKDLISKIYTLLSNDNKNIAANHNYRLILKVNYKRSYFISNQDKFRATIDTHINTSPAY